MGSAEHQGDLWGRESRDWAQLQEVHSRPLWEAMLDAAGVSTGTVVLDAGCGSGGAAVLAAGRGATVHGLDAAEGMIEVARERVPQGDFRVGDLEGLPFADRTFDAVIAASSVQYAASPVAALRELARVARSGSRVAVGLFGAPEKVEYRVVLSAIRDCLPSPPPGGGPFALSDPGVLERLVAEAGMTTIEVGEVDGPFEFIDADTFLMGTMSAGPVQAAVEQVGADALRDAVLTAAEPFRRPDGSIRFANKWLYVVAEPSI